MQNISFPKFIEKYWATLQENADFAKQIDILYHLINTYNKKLFLTEYQNSIKEQDIWVFELMHFLMNHGFCNKKHISILYQYIQTNDMRFTVKYPNQFASKIDWKIDSVLGSRFDWCIVSKDSNSELGIEVKGYGYQYKRNLDSDLHLLLQ